MVYVCFFIATYMCYVVLSRFFSNKGKLHNIAVAMPNVLFPIGLLASSSDYCWLVALILLFLFSLSYYYATVYGELTYGSLASILETNLSEAIEFSKSTDIKSVVKTACSSFFYCGSLIYINNNISVGKGIESFSLILLILSVLSFIYVLYSENEHYKPLSKVLKYNVVLNITLHTAKYIKYKRLINKVAISSAWSTVSSKAKDNSVYVVVIGESACRDHFHVYGYDVLNTPDLENMLGYQIVENVYSPATQTMLSIPRILASNHGNQTVKFDLNIIDLANDAGFDTYWISNQGQLGKADTEITMLANRAKEKFFLQANYLQAESDFSLLDYVNKVTSVESTKPKLIFLHTMGSHADFYQRSQLGKYKLPETTSKYYHYDNTIYNTHMLLEDLREMLAARTTDYKICYFSDHGLAKVDSKPYLTHAVGKLFCYDAASVPLFFIDNNDLPGKVIDKTYYMRDFVHTLADWLDISAQQVDTSCSILSSSFIEQNEFVLDDALNVVKRSN